MIIKISDHIILKKKKRKKMFLMFLVTIIGSIIYINGKNKAEKITI